MYKLVIFDLDGTILNTLEDLLQSCNYVLSKHNLELVIGLLDKGITIILPRSMAHTTA